MLVLDCKIGCIIKLRKDNCEISIKILKKYDTDIDISVLSLDKFLLDNIRYSFKLIKLVSGQDFIITAFGSEKIRVVLIDAYRKISIGFDADKSVHIRKIKNRKRQ